MSEVDAGEKRLLLEGIYLRYGYDFRDYSTASFDRRLTSVMQKFGATKLIDLLPKVYSDKEFFLELLPMLTIGTTEHFRDPLFFKALREEVIPVLRTYPNIRIWTAGCSTGEEVYSLAILLKEEGLYDRSTIFATDINPRVLAMAKEGIYPTDVIQGFVKNYVMAGGTHVPSEYYTAEYGLACMNPSLRENITFSEHNLTVDGVFTEAHLILCRNVMIYFSRELQNRVLDLFLQSLVHRGFLGLGSKESVRFSSAAEKLIVVNSDQKIFQKDLVHGNL